MNSQLQDFVRFIGERDGINDKGALSQAVVTRFGLTKDRSVFYCADFAVRFSASASVSFGNTVLSLSNLKKFDDRPFVVCLVTPTANHCFLANTTLLKKISHSSQELRENNIRGSFNGSDIIRTFEGIQNNAANLERLFEIHAGIGFDGNLVRLVEATNNISPTGAKFAVGAAEEAAILSAPTRAASFVNSADARTLKAELDAKVEKFKNEILLASLIENVNVRGRIIEYLIAGEDEKLRGELVHALKNREKGIPAFKTENALGDYQRIFDAYHTETDVKTKIMILNSNPKAYNIDKMLEFLAHEKSVFMFYFVGVDATMIVNTVLVSMFETNLLNCTIMLRHWAGRNSRGVTQFEGRTINSLIGSPTFAIDPNAAAAFLRKLIAL
jgi:hypothetical protein